MKRMYVQNVTVALCNRSGNHVMSGNAWGGDVIRARMSVSVALDDMDIHVPRNKAKLRKAVDEILEVHDIQRLDFGKCMATNITDDIDVGFRGQSTFSGDFDPRCDVEHFQRS